MKGTYLLIIEVPDELEVEIGSLGDVKFPAGKYVYVGSALNGIEPRVHRHLSSEKKLYWHIDYLLNHPKVEVDSVRYKEGQDKETECETAEKISQFSEPVDSFGSSDCDCNSHLFRLNRSARLNKLNYKVLNQF